MSHFYFLYIEIIHANELQVIPHFKWTWIIEAAAISKNIL